MDSSRHVVAVLSPEFLKADWPRFEWKNIVVDDPNNKKRAPHRGVFYSLLLWLLSSRGIVLNLSFLAAK
jgi:hypothetical protein